MLLKCCAGRKNRSAALENGILPPVTPLTQAAWKTKPSYAIVATEDKSINTDKEVVTWLMKEGDVATAIVSFHEGTRSEESIQALEDTEVYYITKEELEEVYDTYEAFNRHGRVLTTQYYLEGRKQYNEWMLLSAKGRYQSLEKKKPNLIARVPAKYLAAYLRITEVHLSNIKVKLNDGGKDKKHPIG